MANGHKHSLFAAEHLGLMHALLLIGLTMCGLKFTPMKERNGFTVTRAKTLMTLLSCMKLDGTRNYHTSLLFHVRYSLLWISSQYAR